MKKLILIVVAAFALGLNTTTAQSSYTGAIGLGVDSFNGATLVGPSGKYFFDTNNVGQVDLGFENGLTALTFLYAYHKEFSGAKGLRWYAGAGPSLLFFNGNTEIAIRPHAGLDYKINGVPLAFSFDWRPFVGLGDLGSEAGAFGLGFRYAFN